MERYTLEAVNVEQKTSKAGKPYLAAGIKVNGKWYNGMGKEFMRQWKAGDTVTIELFQEEYNGKMYDKFKVPDRVELLEARVEKLEKHLLFNGPETSAQAVSAWTPQPEEKTPEEGFSEDLPF